MLQCTRPHQNVYRSKKIVSSIIYFKIINLPEASIVRIKISIYRKVLLFFPTYYSFSDIEVMYLSVKCKKRERMLTSYFT
jgi:hypothetical protein